MFSTQGKAQMTQTVAGHFHGLNVMNAWHQTDLLEPRLPEESPHQPTNQAANKPTNQLTN